MRAPSLRLSLLWIALAACRDPQAHNPAAVPAGPPPEGPPESSAPASASPDQIAAAQLTATPASMHPVGVPPNGATFGGGAVRYLGWDFGTQRGEAGSTARLSHYWQVLKPVPGDWKIFVHLEPSGIPGALLNADHVAIQGGYPTSAWRVGTIFRDDQFLRLPSEPMGDHLTMYVGLYQGDQRLPLDQPQLGTDNRLRAGAIPLGGGGGAPEQVPLPIYRAPRAKGPIKIDGVLDEPDWAHAPSTGPFTRTMDGSPAHYRTEAKILWDDLNLYVAFTCQDEDVWSSYTRHDDTLYNQEVVEVFIDADGDGKTYNELEVSPGNVTFDAYFPARRQGMDLSWESGMKSAVRVDGTYNDPSDVDRGWTAEIAIPIVKHDAPDMLSPNLASMPHIPPRPGDRWRINLYRLDWQQQRRVNEATAFSPVYAPDFHNLPRFGWLEFAQ
jgi:Carbohydrate family 9 binding domain-like